MRTTSDRRAVIAVDVGGTTVKGAVMNPDGVLVGRRKRPTLGGESEIDGLVELLDVLYQDARAAGGEPVAAAVVTPGVVDEATGVVQYASNLGWRDIQLREILTAASPVPVVTGHDVRAAGLAERRLGAARGMGDVVFVGIGTGVSAALVTDGRNVLGAIFAAGELGHIPIQPEGEVCTCGQRGCLEVYVSGAGLARRYLARSGVSATSEQVVARLGVDEDARQVWTDAIAALAGGLSTITLLLDPACVVIGGGFARAGDALLLPLRERLAASLSWRSAPKVVIGELGSDAALIGAAILAREAADESTT